MASQIDFKVKSLENIIENTRTYKIEDVPGFREASRKRYSSFSASTLLYFVRNISKDFFKCGSVVLENSKRPKKRSC